MADAPVSPYYRDDLAHVHHLGFGFHADMCAAGVNELLDPVRARRGLVLEIGCGTGLLTKYLLEAGNQVLATDASPAMLAIARDYVPGADLRTLRLPTDPVPEADSVVGIGHALNYLATEDEVEKALIALARSLRPGGVFALDLCDLRWGGARVGQAPKVWRGEGWFLVTETSTPSPDRYIREMTTFVRQPDLSWRRDDERHDNVLVDTAAVPELLRAEGVEAEVRPAFGSEKMPEGLVAIVGVKR